MRTFFICNSTLIGMKELNQVGGYLASILTSTVEKRFLLEATESRHEIWCRYEALKNRVHETCVVLTILQTQEWIARINFLSNC